jgi:hypothetical protein
MICDSLISLLSSLFSLLSSLFSLLSSLFSLLLVSKISVLTISQPAEIESCNLKNSITKNNSTIFFTRILPAQKLNSLADLPSPESCFSNITIRPYQSHEPEKTNRLKEMHRYLKILLLRPNTQTNQY